MTVFLISYSLQWVPLLGYELCSYFLLGFGIFSFLIHWMSWGTISMSSLVNLVGDSSFIDEIICLFVCFYIFYLFIGLSTDLSICSADHDILLMFIVLVD